MKVLFSVVTLVMLVCVGCAESYDATPWMVTNATVESYSYTPASGAGRQDSEKAKHVVILRTKDRRLPFDVPHNHLSPLWHATELGDVVNIKYRERSNRGDIWFEIELLNMEAQPEITPEDPIQ